MWREEQEAKKTNIQLNLWVSTPKPRCGQGDNHCAEDQELQIVGHKSQLLSCWRVLSLLSGQDQIKHLVAVLMLLMAFTSGWRSLDSECEMASTQFSSVNNGSLLGNLSGQLLEHLKNKHSIQKHSCSALWSPHTLTLVPFVRTG